uniref:protein YgfX n=1 Tax=Pseudomonas fluorescens TaxID=294 RepID=UPI00130E484E|nr:protein YgfX [Pseudomonas fluorescens]
MSSPNEHFECRWQGSRHLLTAYLACQALACLALLVSAAPDWLRASFLLACLAHAAWAIPRRILLTHPCAVTGLRRDPRGWQLFSRAHGWQPARLCRDSLALPGMVVLRFVVQGRRLSQTQCIALDALAPDQHRRLRLRLKFSRRRWAAAG